MEKQKRRFTPHVMIIGCILLCTVCLRLYFYVGMGPRDDIAYIGLAHTTWRYAYPSESIHLWDLKKAARLVPLLTSYPVYADTGSVHKLQFLTGYQYNLRGYPSDQQEFKTISQAWVVFDLCDESFVKGWRQKHNIPPNWVEVFCLSGPDISHFGRYDAKIYWAP